MLEVRKKTLALALCAMLIFEASFMTVVSAENDKKEDEDDEDLDDDTPLYAEFVTCGSVLKLEHVQTGRRLHSHDVKYGSGSGQQSVTGYSPKDDSNSLWVVHTFAGTEGGRGCVQGAYIRDGAVVKLTHLNTGKNLHSHGQHTSPLSGNQEVSAYGEDGVGDAGDKWILQLEPLEGDVRKRAEADGTNKYWRRGQKFRLQHVDTGLYLSAAPKSIYSNPIAGQMEINCLKKNKSAKDRALTVWRSAEGYFFPSRNN